MALGRFHAERLEPDILGVGHDADRDDAVAEAVLGRLAIAGLDLRRDALRVGGQALDPRAGEDRQALLLQALGELRADLGILDRNHAVEHLDHRHLGAQVGVEARKLDPDRARADDQQLGRHFRRGHRVAIGPDALAVGLGERQVAGPGAGRDDDVLGVQLGRLAVGSGDRQLALAVSVPSPITTAILFFFIRCVTPWLSCFATARLRATTLAKIERRLLVAEAVGVGVLHIVKISAERSSALVGMQPQLRQIPPSSSRSTIAVLRPSCARGSPRHSRRDPSRGR